LIQFSSFSERPGEVGNYGVAPDFACGYKVYLPSWLSEHHDGEFLFIDRRYYGKHNIPSLYLAIYTEGDFGLLEAFDTWLHPEVTFEEFKAHVLQVNAGMHLLNNTETAYVTMKANRIHFVIWHLDLLVHHAPPDRVAGCAGNHLVWAIAANHVVVLQGRRQRVDALKRQLHDWTARCVGLMVAGVGAYSPRIGHVRLTRVRINQPKRPYLYLVTNDRTCTPSQAWACKISRWPIEPMFRDEKQLLDLAGCQSPRA
jgi:hypothetical protein